MKSYESSNKIVKFWRRRWYLYAHYLHFFKNVLDINLILDLILGGKIDTEDKEKLREQWRYIVRHVELNKMNKLTTSKNKDINLRS